MFDKSNAKKKLSIGGHHGHENYVHWFPETHMYGNHIDRRNAQRFTRQK